jgi:hypothetical protein
MRPCEEKCTVLFGFQVSEPVMFNLLVNVGFLYKNFVKSND